MKSFWTTICMFVWGIGILTGLLIGFVSGHRTQEVNPLPVSAGIECMLHDGSPCFTGCKYSPGCKGPR